MNNKVENLLVFGCSGLLGKCLIDYYQKHKKIKIHAAINKSQINNRNVKIVNLKKIILLNKYIKKNNIDTIINFAGLTNIELCEKNIGSSKISNFIVPAKLARISKQHNINYIFISTDNFKFRGKKLSENLKIKSLNKYSLHKKNSENKILQIYSKALVIRTNFYCVGNHKRQSFSDIIINQIKLRNKISLFKDVYYTPIYGKFLLKYMFKLIEKKESGIFNISSNEKITKYNFGLKVCDIFRLDKKLIKVSYLKNRKDLVKRPFNMALDNSKLKKKLKIKLPSIHQQLKVMKRDFR